MSRSHGDPMKLTDSEVEDLLVQLGRSGRITLPTELRARLVYQLLDEGFSVDEIAAGVKGAPLMIAEPRPAEIENMLLQLGRSGRITLRTELRQRLVYELLDAGMSVDDVADMVKGVGPQTVRSLSQRVAR